MKIWTKKWTDEYNGHVIRIEHTQFLSLRTSIKLIFDDVIILETTPRFEFYRDELAVGHMIDGRESKISLLTGYTKSGLKLIYQLKIDGIWIGGEREFENFYDTHMPDRSFLWYLANKGVPSGVVYIGLMMFISKGMTLERAAAMFVFFSFFMNLVFYGMSRLVYKNSK